MGLNWPAARADASTCPAESGMTDCDRAVDGNQTMIAAKKNRTSDIPWGYV
jgi:hypothetical protein